MSKKTVVTTVDDASVEFMLELLGGADETLNENNRAWGQALSQSYANVMLQGRWVPLRVHVIRDTKKQLHNSQHCLKAAIMAETIRLADPDYYKKTYGIKGPITLDLIIEDGILPEWANYIDTGKGRKQHDVVYRHHPFSGEKSGAIEKKLSGWYATAAKIVWARVQFGEKVRTSRKFLFPDLTEVMNTNPGLLTSTEFMYNLDMDIANEGANGTLWIKPLNIPASYLVAAHYLATFSQINDTGEPLMVEKANEFFTALVYGTIATKGNPIYELREWLLKQSAPKGNENLNRLYDAVVVAWNTWIEGGDIAPKAFSNASLKASIHYEMGGLDTAPPAVEEAVEEAPAEEAPAPKVTKEPKAPAKKTAKKKSGPAAAAVPA